MEMNQYQELAARTINGNLKPEEALLHALHGMSAEVGEIHSLFQKLYQGHPLDEVHLMKECGDLLWFIAEYCTVLEFGMDEVAQMNIDKLKERYPDGFDAERSLNRAEGDI